MTALALIGMIVFCFIMGWGITLVVEDWVDNSKE